MENQLTILFFKTKIFMLLIDPSLKYQLVELIFLIENTPLDLTLGFIIGTSINVGSYFFNTPLFI